MAKDNSVQLNSITIKALTEESAIRPQDEVLADLLLAYVAWLRERGSDSGRYYCRSFKGCGIIMIEKGEMHDPF